MEVTQGLVIRTQGGHYYVQAGQFLYDCTLRGKLKHGRSTSDIIAVGDQVRFITESDGYGVINLVLPRKSAFSRCPPPPRRPVEQVIVANPDQVLVVFAASSPPLNPLMLDRYLVACEAAGLKALIVVNKMDESTTGIVQIIELYRSIGYAVWPVSAVTGEGLERLHAELLGKLTVMVGPSGVGKSSLLNFWWPELQLPTDEISYYHDRGKHTTVVTELLHPEPNVYIADTPGLRQLRFWQVFPQNFEKLFIEFASWREDCQYESCTHLNEPGCAVRAAVEQGAISTSRYHSYCRMYELGF